MRAGSQHLFGQDAPSPRLQPTPFAGRCGRGKLYPIHLPPKFTLLVEWSQSSCRYQDRSFYNHQNHYLTQLPHSNNVPPPKLQMYTATRGLDFHRITWKTHRALFQRKSVFGTRNSTACQMVLAVRLLVLCRSNYTAAFVIDQHSVWLLEQLVSNYK